MKSTIFTSSLHAFDETSLFDINKTHAFRQIAFFQFSSSSVIDTFHNIYLESWAFVVDQTIIPSLLRYLNLSEHQMIKSLESIRNKLNDRIAQHGKLELILSKAKKYADKKIFNVPKDISLEEGTEIPDDENDVLKRIEELEEQLITLRLKIQHAKKKRRNSEFYKEFLKTFN